MNDRQLRMIKKAFMPLTDQAMAAQGAPMPPQGGAPMPPPGGAPMAPPQGGGMPPVDPATGMPMDPNMMAAQGAPMPPQGGMPPVDPNTGMPMDPNMMAAQGGMPPQGGAPIQTGDMVIDMLLQMGAMIIDPNGQPVPPEILAQLVAEMNAQTGGMPQGGAPGVDPNSDAVLETCAQMDKNISVLIDKVDSIRALIDNERGAEPSPKDSAAAEDASAMDAELQAFLEQQAAAGSPMVDPNQVPMEAIPQGGLDPQQAQQLGLMQAMQAGQY